MTTTHQQIKAWIATMWKHGAIDVSARDELLYDLDVKRGEFSAIVAAMRQYGRYLPARTFTRWQTWQSRQISGVPCKPRIWDFCRVCSEGFEEEAGRTLCDVCLTIARAKQSHAHQEICPGLQFPCGEPATCEYRTRTGVDMETARSVSLWYCPAHYAELTEAANANQ